MHVITHPKYSDRSYRFLQATDKEALLMTVFFSFTCFRLLEPQYNTWAPLNFSRESHVIVQGAQSYMLLHTARLLIRLCMETRVWNNETATWKLLFHCIFQCSMETIAVATASGSSCEGMLQLLEHELLRNAVAAAYSQHAITVPPICSSQRCTVLCATSRVP